MGIQVSKIESHWNYFISIEEDVERLSRYVDFNKKNFKCFSIEISRILFSASAETDVVCKQICRNLNPQSTASSINPYKREILKAYSGIPKFRVTLPRYGLELKPWSPWARKGDPPKWWTAYNKIKHDRDTEYDQRNLENTLNSVAGLFVMVLYLYKQKAELGELLPPAKLFRVSEDNFRGATYGGFEMGINYVL